MIWFRQNHIESPSERPLDKIECPLQSPNRPFNSGMRKLGTFQECSFTGKVVGVMLHTDAGEALQGLSTGIRSLQ